MPWEDRGIIEMRKEFVYRAKDLNENISALCREYDISRPTAYKWIARYEKEGHLGLLDRSKRPARMPNRTDEDFIYLILSIRDKYPAWGARKLRQVLLNQGHQNLPSESTFNRIIQREKKILSNETPTSKNCIRFERQKPNELWQMDFKGHFQIVEGRCHPLTILDDCSRYSLCLKACLREDEFSVRSALEVTFQEHGLPEAMTMDNGSPWMGSPGHRFSKLTVWLMKLGIRVSHSRPYHPQTQGKDERFHRSLKEELLRFHNFKNLFEAQKGFDDWRHLYNNIRPHQALGMSCPSEKYQLSSRKYTDKLPQIEYLPTDEVRTVSHAGEIRFKGDRYFIGESLRGENVAVRQRNEKKWDVYYINSWLKSFEKNV